MGTARRPVPFTQAKLVETLRAIADAVEAGDSFEGSIEYLMPTEEQVPEDTYAMVRASFRVGNSIGQGSVVLVGEPL